MKSYFAINHNPDAKDLKQLAQKTGLTKRVLQVRVIAATTVVHPTCVSARHSSFSLTPKWSLMSSSFFSFAFFCWSIQSLDVYPRGLSGICRCCFFLSFSFFWRERKEKVVNSYIANFVSSQSALFTLEQKKGLIKLSQLKTNKANESVNCSILFWFAIKIHILVLSVQHRLTGSLLPCPLSPN